MLYSLKGTLVHKDALTVAIDCGGVAYLCLTTLGTVGSIGELGQEVKVFTHLNVRENAVDLFGFSTQSELSCFRMLIGVTGVGPKVALSILSSITPEQVALAIAADDYKALTVASGVGAKLAQRIVLELRDKVKNDDLAKAVGGGAASIQIGAGNIGEAVSALVVLGYSQTQAASVLGGYPPETPVQDLIKAALKALAGNN
ncbi:MAG: Holliday junction branch migration protein RuvA [Oscillospiraceae bacterium]